MNETNINWYPGHMEKTKRQLKELMPIVDFCIELIDARIPYSSKIQEIDEIIKNKPVILVFTKMDLCDAEETRKWIEYYENKGYAPVSLSLKEGNAKLVIKEIDKIADTINNKRRANGMKPKVPRGIVIGTPNVGKSTLINKLALKKVAGVANTPGFTKNISWLKTNSALLLDSPGILWPKFNAEEIALNLASVGAIRQEVLPIDDVAKHILSKLSCYYPELLQKRYGIDKLDDYEENITQIGKRLSIYKKGGIIDSDKVALTILNDFKNEKIKGVTLDRLE